MDQKQAYKLNHIAIDRILCLMVVVVSGNLAVGILYMPLVVVFPVLVLGAVAIQRRVHLLHSDMYIVLLICALFAIQLSAYGMSIFSSNASFVFKLLTALLVIRVIPEFDRRLIEVMYGLAIISLIFYIPLLMGIDMAQLLKPISIPLEQHNDIQPSVHIGIHNYRMEVGDLQRNCGIFWEPGAYAGYLIFSMLLLLNSRLCGGGRYFLVLSMALLSTQSTTGYVAYSIIVLAYLWKSTTNISTLKKIVTRSMFAVALPSVMFVAYSQLDFLEEKITRQLIVGDEQLGKHWELSRFGNALYDLELIVEHPLMGLSMSDSTRLEEDEDVLTRQGNGLTGAATRLGVPFVLLYMGMVFWGFKRRSESIVLAFIVTATVIVLLIGEQFLKYPLFLVLVYKFSPDWTRAVRARNCRDVNPYLTMDR